MAIGLDEYKIIINPISAKPLSDDEDEEWSEFEIKPRTMDEVAEVTEQFVEKIWFDRHLTLRYKVENGMETVDPKIWAGALKSAKKVIQKYGGKNLGPYSDFEWGMLNGKLSALRWVLGEDWDMLDT